MRKYEITENYVKVDNGIDWGKIIDTVKNVKLTKRQQEVLEVLRRNNFNHTETAKDLGIRRENVSRIWARVKGRYKKCVTEDNVKLFINDIRYVNIDVIRKMCEHDRLSHKQIGKELEIPRTVVADVCQQNNFINPRAEIHNKRYTHSDVKGMLEKEGYKLLSTFTKVTEPVMFECPHGHIHSIRMADWINQGSRCGKCKTTGGWLFTPTIAERNREEYKETPATVYVVRMFGNNEEFYKIGITTRDDIRYRMHGIPYEFEVIKLIKTNLYDACYIEEELHVKHYECRYMPKIKFGGCSECFSDINMEIIKNI